MENEAELVERIDEIGPDLDIELEDWTRNYINDEFSRCIKSLCVFPRNFEIGSPNTFINDSWQSKILCEFRAGDAGLGNRRPTPEKIKLKLCPLCKEGAKTSLVNESHVLISCQALASLREDIGMRSKIKSYEIEYKTTNPIILCRLFLGGDNCDKATILNRAYVIKKLREAWWEKLQSVKAKELRS